MQGHTALYRSFPPLPEVKCPDYLKPSAYKKSREYRPSLDPGSDDPIYDSDHDFTLAKLQKKSGKGTSKEDADVLGGEALPSHPKGPRLVRKCKVAVISVDGDEESK